MTSESVSIKDQLVPVNVLAQSHGRWLALATHNHLYVVDRQSNELRALQGHESVIRSLYWHHNTGDDQPRYLVSAGDDKQLFVWNCSDWSRSAAVVASKKITCAQMVGTGDDTAVLYADKFGNVYLYPLAAHASVAARTARRVQQSSAPVKDEAQDEEDDEAADGLTLLLGHFSSITSLALDHTARLIVTADRDEKIRVSHYPNAYNIRTFCLGHTQFVSKVLVPHVTSPCVLSGAGDGTVRGWDLSTGAQLGLFDLATASLTRPDSEAELIVSDMAYHHTGLLAVSIEGLHEVLVLRVQYEAHAVQFTLAETIKHDSDVFVLAFDQHAQLWIGGDKDATGGLVSLYHLSAAGTATRDTESVQKINQTLHALTVDSALRTQVVESLKLRQYKKMSHKENKKRKLEQQN